MMITTTTMTMMIINMIMQRRHLNEKLKINVDKNETDAEQDGQIFLVLSFKMFPLRVFMRALLITHDDDD